MYELINNIWSFLESSVANIEMLEELKESKNFKLSEQAKYTLTKAYEQQAKDRNYPNSYYKKLFDKDEKMDGKKIINNYGNYVEGDNLGTMTLKKGNKDSINKKWYQKWWFISLGVGTISGGITWWYINWSFGIFAFIISFLITMFFNPERRFWRSAWIILTLSGISIFPKIVGNLKIPENELFNGIIKFGENIPLPLSISLLILAGFLFWLDYKENKNDN
jgi:hypothetical protein